MEHGGKRTRRTKAQIREDKVNDGQRQIKEKFLEERKFIFQKVKPLNELQAQYIDMCRTLPIIIASGYAGTSKTYIPTCIAAEKWYLGEIDKIYLVRPAVSSSKSLGFFGGSLIEKSKNWLAPVLDTLYEKLGRNVVDLAIERGQIEPVPLETIKGRSMKNCFIIVDEAEDLCVDEFVKVVTRIGSNATMVFAGDILQSDIQKQNGISLAIQMAQDDPLLEWGFVDFNRPSDIVRSDAARNAILAFRRKGLM